EDEEGHGHDHSGGMDPHFWMDPLRVKEAVGNVRRGLTEVDAEDADVYAENAEAFNGHLDDLHERIETIVADASNDAILIAGHDSFGYFSDRYGVRIEALTSVSPDDIPTPRDIEAAQEVISTHDLRYICADPLESQAAAEQLVAETDAEEVLPLTAMPGLTDEWAEDEWGYLDVMENVNLPTIERVLNA
ncbi:MAG: metal ABC transporter substrate-binding protein, partial [Natronomonas sp.]|uniref:metal ABC transporter substrate-binding protein n=1 Tax=Natronomonas sp. TaxID=2184060 RepID=UPI0028700AD9